MKKILSLIFMYLLGVILTLVLGFVIGTGAGFLILPKVATHLGALLSGITFSFWTTGFKTRYLSK